MNDVLTLVEFTIVVNGFGRQFAQQHAAEFKTGRRRRTQDSGFTTPHALHS